MGPLDIRSIAKMVEWVADRPYKVTEDHAVNKNWPRATNPEIVCQVLDTVWTELALHGEERYTKWVLELVPNLPPGCSPPPTWKGALERLGYKL